MSIYRIYNLQTIRFTWIAIHYWVPIYRVGCDWMGSLEFVSELIRYYGQIGGIKDNPRCGKSIGDAAKFMPCVCQLVGLGCYSDNRNGFILCLRHLGRRFDILNFHCKLFIINLSVLSTYLFPFAYAQTKWLSFRYQTTFIFVRINDFPHNCNIPLSISYVLLINKLKISHLERPSHPHPPLLLN